MSPAYDGLSEEQRKLKSGEWILHTCNNGIPKENTRCPFCSRPSVSSEESLSFLIEKRKAELKDEMQRLKLMNPAPETS